MWLQFNSTVSKASTHFFKIPYFITISIWHWMEFALVCSYGTEWSCNIVPEESVGLYTRVSGTKVHWQDERGGWKVLTNDPGCYFNYPVVPLPRWAVPIPHCDRGFKDTLYQSSIKNTHSSNANKQKQGHTTLDWNTFKCIFAKFKCLLVHCMKREQGRASWVRLLTSHLLPVYMWGWIYVFTRWFFFLHPRTLELL